MLTAQTIKNQHSDIFTFLFDKGSADSPDA